MIHQAVSMNLEDLGQKGKGYSPILEKNFSSHAITLSKRYCLPHIFSVGYIEHSQRAKGSYHPNVLLSTQCICSRNENPNIQVLVSYLISS